MQWSFGGFTEKLYFSDHGLSLKDHGPVRPETFYFIVHNGSSEKVDVLPNNAIISKTEFTPRRFWVILDHQKITREENLLIKVGQRVFTLNLQTCNFNDWNVTSSTLYVYQDSIFIGQPEDFKYFEFIIEFKIQEGLSTKNIEIKANHLLTTYIDDENNSIRAVFDYSLFMANPEFQVKVGRRRHLIKLKEYQLEGTAYHLLNVYKKHVR